MKRKKDNKWHYLKWGFGFSEKSASKHKERLEKEGYKVKLEKHPAMTGRFVVGYRRR